MLDFQEFTPVAELLDDPVVTMVLLDDKVTIVPLEIMSQDIDLSGIVECLGIQPFQKISGTRGARERLGFIVVFGFGHEEISNVFLVGLHGFNIKKHVQGGQVVLLLLWEVVSGSAAAAPRLARGPPWCFLFLFFFLS